jgi:TP901 family phage tail tape measure protein
VSLGQAVVDVGADTSGFESQLDRGVKRAASKADSALSKIGRGTTKAGRNLTLGVTAPLAAIATQAVRTQATFEQSMNLLGVNAGIGGKRLDSLGDLAKKMGADTVFSANEAASAMLELSKGGFKAAQISGGGIQATLALAATEGLNLADAATITGNALNSFGLKAKDAGTIADSLAAGSAASSASVASLAEGLGNVGPIAKQSGLSLQDTVAALSELDQAGIRGAEGGTALRSFLTRLVPTGKKAKEAIHGLGLEFKNADGSFKDLGEISGQLQSKLGKLSESQRAEALQSIFGAYAKQAAAVFLEKGAKGYENYTTQVNKSGTAQKLADARMSGTAGAIEKMRGSVDTASLALGEALAPTVVKVTGGIEKLANWFTNLDDGTQSTIATLGAVAAALGPILFITGKTITTIQTLSSTYGKLSASMATSEGKARVLSGTLRTLAGVGGMIAVADGSRRMSEATDTSSRSLGALETTAGAAAAGFAVGGPWGAAVGTVLGFSKALWSASKATAAEDKATQGNVASMADYVGSIDAATAAITKQTRATIYDRLEKSGLLAQTQALGISDNVAVKAVLGNVAARRTLTTAIDAQTDAHKKNIALNVAQRLLGEERALDATRLAQLQKNVAIAKTKGEVEKAQAALDRFARTHATPTIAVTGTKTVIKELNAINTLISEISGSHTTAGITPPSGSIYPPTKASGGGVVARRPYFVGDNPDGSLNRTSELFWPGSSGTIVSARKLRAALQSPGATTGTTSIDHSRKVELTVVNPVAERTSESLPRALSTLAFVLGG